MFCFFLFKNANKELYCEIMADGACRDHRIRCLVPCPIFSDATVLYVSLLVITSFKEKDFELLNRRKNSHLCKERPFKERNVGSPG